VKSLPPTPERWVLEKDVDDVLAMAKKKNNPELLTQFAEAHGNHLTVKQVLRVAGGTSVLFGYGRRDLHDDILVGFVRTQGDRLSTADVRLLADEAKSKLAERELEQVCRAKSPTAIKPCL
jgi:hypothetical protein